MDFVKIPANNSTIFVTYPQTSDVVVAARAEPIIFFSSTNMVNSDVLDYQTFEFPFNYIPPNMSKIYFVFIGIVLAAIFVAGLRVLFVGRCNCKNRAIKDEIAHAEADKIKFDI